MPSVFFVSPVVDIASCHRLRTYRGRKGMLQCTVLEVALASISTLGLFDHAEIGTGRRKYTSAGMNHTNPIKDVLDEAEQIFGKDQRVACILSLGAGVSLQTTMPSNLAHLEVHGLLQAMDMQHAVEHHADEYLNNPSLSSELNAVADQLSAGRGTITLGGLSKLEPLGLFSPWLIFNCRQCIRRYRDSQICTTCHSILRVAKEIMGIHRGESSRRTNGQAEHIRSFRNGWLRQVDSAFILCANIWVEVS